MNEEYLSALSLDLIGAMDRKMEHKFRLQGWESKVNCQYPIPYSLEAYA